MLDLAIARKEMRMITKTSVILWQMLESRCQALMTEVLPVD